MNIRSAPGDEGARIKHWTSHVSVEEAEKLTRTYADVLGSILDHADQTVSSIGPIRVSAEDRVISDETKMHTKEQVSDEPNGVKDTQPAEPPSPVASYVGATRPPNLRSKSYREFVKDCVQETIEKMFKGGDLVGYTQSSDEVSTMVDRKLENLISNPAEATGTWTSPDVEAGSFEMMSRLLRSLWSSLLDIAETNIRANDSFFVLGGDSILAMELARSAREVGLTLTVADIFGSPVFSEMAHLLVFSAQKINHDIKAIRATSVTQEGATSDIMEDSRFSLLDAANAEAFIQDYICPKIGVFRGGIVDVFPVTDFQALAVAGTLVESKWMLNYITFDGQGFLDLERLRKSAYKLVQLFDILRTVFIPCGNRFFQVVLRALRPQVQVHETQEDFDTYTRHLRDHGQNSSPRLGEPYVQFILLRRPIGHAHRIILRLSHAQYDGVCLPKIIEAFRAGYEGKPLLLSPPFASYVAQATGSASRGHYEYWQGLLQGSSMTEFVHREQPKYSASDLKSAILKKTIKLPPLTTKNITPATILKAAWTITLAQLSGSSDVVFGNLISGRNVAIEGVESIVGPCLNIIPVRIKLEAKWTALDLLRRIQGQQVAGMPFESLGFREIVQHCTDWPEWTYFPSMVQHQNLAEDVALHLDRTKYKVGFLGAQDTLADLTVVSTPKPGDTVEICLGFVDDGTIRSTLVTKALNLMCSLAQSFANNPNSTIPSVLNGIFTTRPLLQKQHSEIVIPKVMRSQEPALHVLTKADTNAITSTLRRAWRLVLPSINTSTNASTNTSFLNLDLNSSFYALGGDLIGLASLTAFLEGEGYGGVTLEELIRRPTLGEMVDLLAAKEDRSAASARSEGGSRIDEVDEMEGGEVVGEERIEKKLGIWSKSMRLARRVKGMKGRDRE